MFDWDQLQRGWWLWDLAQPLVGLLMLCEAGLPVLGTPAGSQAAGGHASL